MAKASKPKNDPKPTFDGTFDDLLRLTLNVPKFKFRTGDIVVKHNDNKRYIVIGSRKNRKIPYGSDYSIHPEDDKKTILFVTEDEISLAQ